MISKQREATGPGTVFDVNEELQIAETTQYHLIYPMSKDHPFFERSQLAMAKSKMSTVGAALQPVRARARKEALVAQIRAMDQPQSRSLHSSLSQTPATARKIHVTLPSVAVALSVDPLPPLSAEIAMQEHPEPELSSLPVDSSPESLPENEEDAITINMIASPVVATQTKALAPGKGVVFPMATRVIVPVPRSRPGRPSPGVRPLLVQRMAAPARAPPQIGSPTIFDNFKSVPWLAIDQKEEQERLKALRSQACTLRLLYLPERVMNLIDAVQVRRMVPLAKNQLKG
jgi:hypothetical protein